MNALTRIVRSPSASLFLVLLACALLWQPGADAQRAGRARPTGSVSGLELGMEGALRAPRGTTLRWLLTTYEVAGTSELRRAVGASVEITSALSPSAEPLRFTSDALGRVVAEIAIPDDAPDAFGVVLRVTTSGAARRFELSVSVDEPRRLFVHTARTETPRGAPVAAFGRLARYDGTALAEQTVELTLLDDSARPVGAPRRVITDAAGLFASVFATAGDETQSSSYTVRARERSDTDHPLEASASTRVVDPRSQALLVSVAPSQRIVSPDTWVDVEIAVRTAEGRPVAGAQVELPWLPHDDTARLLVTDARGRARTRWRAPRLGRGTHMDASIDVAARREGMGAGSGSAAMRIASADWAMGFAIEGGALLPSLGGRVFVRVVGVDGLPARAGVPVELSGPRVTRATATTDESGLATFDVALGAAPSDPQADPCGGSAGTSVQAQVGAGPRAATRQVCIPLDPDGTLRVRSAAPRIDPGAPLVLDVARVAGVERSAVVVSVLGVDDAAPLGTVATATLPAGATHLEIPIPARAGRALLVRARPIVSQGREVRGGSAMVLVQAAERFALDTRLDPSGQLALDAGGPGSAWSVALPLDEARALERRMRGVVGISESERYDPARATEGLLAALLAVHLPPDAAAPFVMREGRVEAVPAPENPGGEALLRDPWRAQARFITGRLALVFSAIEQHVARSVPEHLSDVAVETRGRWDFNAQILASVAESGELGSEGATGLGGEDLSVDLLRRIDPAFTYDNVARRITRERHYRLLVALRRFVHMNGFDLTWSRLGDPAEWLRHLVGMPVDGGRSIQARELVDAWGRPFILRRVARARWEGLAPLPGWELLSSGPDGRPGNGDDVFDPTARVLPSASAYGQAVDEDLLVARLGGVELGRTTVELLRTHGHGGGVRPLPRSADDAARRQSQELFTQLPSPFEPDPDPLALRRPARPGEGAGGGLSRLEAGPVALTLDEEPREWGSVVVAFRPDGRAALSLSRARAGSALIVEGQLPARIRVDGEVVLPLRITNAGERDLELATALEGDAIQGRAPSLSLAAGTSSVVDVTLSAQRAGRFPVSLTLSAGGQALRTLRGHMSADRARHPIRVRAATVIGGAELPQAWSTRLSVPAGDEGAGRVVLLDPRGASRDPDLSETRRRDPALVAWASIVSGIPLDAELRTRLLAAQDGSGLVRGADSNLSTACALVAWSSADEDDDAAARAAAMARNILGSGGIGADPDGEAGALRSASQELTALGVAGSGDPADLAEGRLDPVGARIASLRVYLRRQLRRYPEEPSLLARAAAALLVADPRDAHGRAMYERAIASVRAVEGSPGGLELGASERRTGSLESLSSTLALALAAHQLGDREQATRLLMGALHRDHVMMRAGGEPLFWWLAAASYGALGGASADASPEVQVEVGGRRVPVVFEHGVGVVPIPLVRGGDSIEVRVTRAGEGLVFARAEVALGARFRVRDDGPVTLQIEGDPGGFGDIAALELGIGARRAVDRLFVELQLPPGVEADEALLGALRGAPYVDHVESREPGYVRVRLVGLAEGAQIALPLPLRWRLSGSLEGLGVIAWAEPSPERMSTLAPRRLDIRSRP